MTSEEALARFGLPSAPRHREEICGLLREEIERARRWEDGEEMLRTLCVQLFSIGAVQDSLLIWEAKRSNFDAGCGLDIQFTCGAGLASTKAFLASSDSAAAAAALASITSCEEARGFEDWTPKVTIDQYRDYYRL